MTTKERLEQERTAHVKRIVEIDREIASLDPGETRKCDVCDSPIPRERVISHPSAKTCSRECADEHKRALRRENARRQYQDKLRVRVNP